MSDNASALHDSAFMQAFLDLVIPPSHDGSLPGAGSLGIAAEIAATIESDAALGPLVTAGLQSVHDAALTESHEGFTALAPSRRAEVVEAQLVAHPMLMIGVQLHLYQAYYQHPTVLEALGEPPRPPFPEGYSLEPTDPQLLDALRARAR